MKIYAIRDTMIDYFLTPFAAVEDKQVMAGVAVTINGASNDAVAQAPHHFEIWQIGSVDQEGTLTPYKQRICNCAELVRTGVREDRTAGPGTGSRQAIPGGLQSPPSGNPGKAGTNHGPTPNAPQAASLAHAHDGGPPGGVLSNRTPQ